jgi:gas vesicle protein
MIGKRIAGVLGAAAVTAVVLVAPACSSNTKDDVKKVGSDLSTDAKSGASQLSTDVQSVSSSIN